MSDRLLDQIKRHEGFRSKPYKCSMGVLTIGYGRNLESNGVSRQEALDMLFTDMAKARKSVIEAVPCATHLDEVRLDTLVNMAFNLGIFGLLKFRRMLAALDAGNYKKASDEMLDSQWANQVGPRAVELAIQMETGQYVPNPP